MSYPFVTYTNTAPAQVLQYAKDVVADRRDNYLFFSSNDNQWTLIMYETVENGVYKDADFITWTRNTSPEVGFYYSMLSTEHIDCEVTIRDDNTIYRSSGLYPRLREGGLSYDFAQTVLLGAVLLFGVLDRIFRHSGVPR